MRNCISSTVSKQLHVQTVLAYRYYLLFWCLLRGVLRYGTVVSFVLLIRLPRTVNQNTGLKARLSIIDTDLFWSVLPS